MNSIQYSWHDDDTVNTYMSLLGEKYRNSKIGYGSSFIPSIATKAKNGHDLDTIKRYKRMSSKMNIESLDKWIIPVNVDNIHWLLCVICPQTHHIFLYDSLYQMPDEIDLNIVSVIDEIRQFLSSYGIINNVEHFYKIPWVTCKMEMQSQEEDYTCGTYVMIVAHINSIIDSKHIPYRIIVKECTKIHCDVANAQSCKMEFLLDLELKQILGIIYWETLNFSGHLNSFGITHCIDYRNILFIYNPGTSNNKKEYISDRIQKERQNCNIIVNKNELYSGQLRHKYGITIIKNSRVINPTWLVNGNVLNSLFTKTINYITKNNENHDTMLDIFSFCNYRKFLFHFEEQFITTWLQFFDTREISLNLLDDSIISSTIVPFEDYNNEVCSEMLELHGNNIHNVVNVNDSLYRINSKFHCKISNVRCWKDYIRWLYSTSQKRFKIIICDNLNPELPIENLRNILNNFKEAHLWTIIIVRLILIPSTDQMCIEIFRYDDYIKKDLDVNMMQVETLHTISNLMYPIDKKEHITRFWAQISILDLVDVQK